MTPEKLECSACTSPEVVTIPDEEGLCFCLGCYENLIAFKLARAGGRMSHKEKQT